MTALDTQGKFREADKLYKKILGSQEESLGPDDPFLAVTLTSRANVLQAQVMTFLSQRQLYGSRLLVGNQNNPCPEPTAWWSG